MIQLPITNEPNQRFRLTLPRGKDNISLDFKIHWNRIAAYWVLDLGDVVTGQPILANWPLLIGEAPAQNLLRQFLHLGIGAAYVVPLSPSSADRPGLTDWGTNHLLLWDPA